MISVTIFTNFLGVLAYGSLEVFFVTWLTVNMDHVFNSFKRNLSQGLLVTVLIPWLSHIIFSPRGGVINIIYILGLIFKHTKNPYSANDNVDTYQWSSTIPISRMFTVNCLNISRTMRSLASPLSLELTI